MPANRKPAMLKKGKSETKEHLDQRAALEDELKGTDSEIYTEIPDSLDEYGKQYYKFIVEKLEPSKILADLDIPLVEQTAESLAQMKRAAEIYHEEGLIITVMDRTGNAIQKEHPAVNTYNKYANLFKTLATQLGLSPSARAQLAELQMQNQEEAEDEVLGIINS
jgi:P27 family predicted phage terminase small subunit